MKEDIKLLKGFTYIIKRFGNLSKVRVVEVTEATYFLTNLDCGLVRGVRYEIEGFWDTRTLIEEMGGEIVNLTDLIDDGAV